MPETSVDPRAVLGATPFFAEVLTPAELDRLATGAGVVAFAEGETLVVEDEPGSSMFVIVAGSAEVTLRGDGGPRHLADLAPGGIVGEGSLLTGATRSATVTARSALTAIEVDKAAIEPLFDAEPKLVERFADSVQRRQAEVDRIYGAGHGNLFGLTRTDLGDAMRTFFGGGI
ncbi:MAG: cyclic nucleotide-binding domain-containing protein [Rhizobiales bacterium]|nr:cyclic nucleotide-binding domain-containing protein [Hyphomicrobiales bacterium]